MFLEGRVFCGGGWFYLTLHLSVVVLLLHLCVTFVVSTSGAPQCARVALKSRSLIIPLTMTSSFVSWMQLASFARNNNNLPFLFDFGEHHCGRLFANGWGFIGIRFKDRREANILYEVDKYCVRIFRWTTINDTAMRWRRWCGEL